MEFADLYEAEKHRAALLEVIIHNAGGWPDRASLVRTETLCEAAIGAIEDAECAARLNTVAEYARALFSERMHLRWHRGGMAGRDFLRLEIIRELHLLNRRLCALEAQRREANVLKAVSATILPCAAVRSLP
jgi:hypothetical protein